MKLNDAVWGALLLALAGALLWHVQGFPTIPGQKVGPSALPGALAVALGICGALLVVSGLRQRTAAAGRWAEWPAWFAHRPQVIAFGVLVAVNLLYVMAVDRLGFVLTGIVYLAAMMLALRVRPLRAVTVAVVMTLLIHYAFYKLLKVPLPWGVLQPLAW
ncbi:tripartite tricarboxylate transporter TctB family protein [Piscinibacter sp. XHJ-5]|uniref:tripartite tricarboxylate transporter TctB family protein n=1 Tax=Piscinibacter sp. XHJ-5 TaxID=3037797 RepID=UPI0024531496|nr:tripartite tricarboxylate transporter TctB family protein [Piscinibacter sp. XHJ-5]